MARQAKGPPLQQQFAETVAPLLGRCGGVTPPSRSLTASSGPGISGLSGAAVSPLALPAGGKSHEAARSPSLP